MKPNKKKRNPRPFKTKAREEQEPENEGDFDGDMLEDGMDDADGGDEDGRDDDREGEGDEASYGNFMKDLAAIEGAPRFLHFDDRRNVDVAISEALGGQQVSIDALLGDLPATNSAAAVKKAVRRSALADHEREGKKKRKRKKGAKAEDDEDGDEANSKSLRLPAPLSAPEHERTARSALYARAKEDVRVWDSVVHSSRAAETKKFPLVKPDLKLATNRDFSATFKPRNPLEEQVMSLLRKSTRAEESTRLSREEEDILAQMTVREAEEKRNEMIRLRILQRHQEAKLKRQKKIKSRTYRKLARKQKEREKEKELEELKRTDPELAAEKMQELDRVRVLERATLRHRNNSKYLQLQAKRAKNDKESQRNITDQLGVHRSLTSKNLEKTDEEEGTGGPLPAGAVESETVEEFNSNFKEFWSQKQQRVEAAKAEAARREKEKERERLEMAAGSLDDLFSEGERIRRKVLDGEGKEAEEEEEREEVVETEKEEEDESLALKTDKDELSEEAKKKRKEEKEERRKKRATLDPDKFVQTLNLAKDAGALPTMAPGGGDLEYEDGDEAGEDFGDAQAAAISEAFAGDDVTADFRSEKLAQLEKDRPKDVDLTLPGWGSWGGQGLTVSKRKRRRFTVRAPPPPKRRDENKGNLIINEREDEKAKKYQVGSVPFPFTSVADFEASLRTPIGDSFVPRTAFKKHIRPRVQTKKGVVIDAMDKEELVKRKIV